MNKMERILVKEGRTSVFDGARYGRLSTERDVAVKEQI
jgi:hypothetical protein